MGSRTDYVRDVLKGHQVCYCLTAYLTRPSTWWSMAGVLKGSLDNLGNLTRDIGLGCSSVTAVPARVQSLESTRPAVPAGGGSRRIKLEVGCLASLMAAWNTSDPVLDDKGVEGPGEMVQRLHDQVLCTGPKPGSHHHLMTDLPVTPAPTSPTLVASEADSQTSNLKVTHLKFFMCMGVLSAPRKSRRQKKAAEVLEMEVKEEGCVPTCVLGL